MTLYVLNYNNYYNRILKKEDTLSAYLDSNKVYELSGVNFNPNDGVNTELILGSLSDVYDGSGDYLLVCDDLDNIVSRWFIIETQRTRGGGQYNAILRRDVIADYQDDIENSPIFVEKATLSQSDPMIFNTENMTFNQIKKSESLLKDETGCAWIVGYMSSKPFDNGLGELDKISSKISYHLPVDEAYASASNYPFYRYSSLVSSGSRQTLFSSPTNRKICIWQKLPSVDSIYQGRKFAFNASGPQNTGILDEVGVSRLIPYNWLGGYWQENFQCPVNAGSSMIWQNSLSGQNLNGSTMLEYFQRGFAGKYENIFNLLETQVGSINPELILAENGKKLFFQDTGKYYKVKVNTISNSGTEILPSYQGNLWLALKAGYDASVTAYNNNPSSSYYNTWEKLTGISAAPNDYSFSINFEATTYELILEEQPEPSLTYEILIDNDRWHLNDAPYDMFCIPYSDTLNINNGGTYLCTANKELAFQTALSLGRDYMGAGYIYDIQLLPYCPVRECIKADNTFDVQSVNHFEIKSYTETGSYTNGTVVGTVLFGTVSNFTLNIPLSIPVTDKKIQSNCEMWRLCSPNYSGLFEFNIAKNDGVEFFNVDCTYKPYNPYIHINPNFKGMYGYDANDMRGLVCGGDFSLPNISDSWKTYELNNKNYQEIFDRNIQSMELRNNIQDSKDVFNAITGTVIGGAAGAVTGAKGGVAGAVAGGIIGTAASAIGGIMDVSYNRLLRKDALDLTKDQFGYQLGNIQALPYSLAKTSAFTANNKLWPFLEYYSCTPEEKLALANKIAYNGMTVMRIGKIPEFKNNAWSYLDINSENYFKGKLIRLTGTGDDYHIVNAIADELNLGVYL